MTPLSRRDFATLAAFGTASALIDPREMAAAAAAARPAAGPAWGPGGRTGWPSYDAAIVIDNLATPGPFNVPDSTAAPYTAEMVANAKASGITAVNVTL
ncbi:MAG: hypothetical protein P3A27_07950, partial [Gemmatimonadota bacterium]|nr:hypothetical protein [Gemmatimonadota bacterium]